MTTSNNVCILACSDEFSVEPEFLERLMALSQLWANEFSVQLNKFGYDWESGEGQTWDLHSAIHPMSDRLGLQNAVLKPRKIGFWFLSEKRSINLPSGVLLNVEVRVDEASKGCKYIYVQLPEERLSNGGDDSQLPNLVTVLRGISSLGKIAYGLVTRMSDSKWTHAYFQNIGNSHLSYDERLDMLTWKEHAPSFRSKLRGLYWGNVLGPGHLAQVGNADSFVAQISLIVGEPQVVYLESDSVFFAMPSRNHATHWTRVQELLRQYDLLMSPDAAIESNARLQTRR